MSRRRSGKVRSGPRVSFDVLCLCYQTQKLFKNLFPSAAQVNEQ